MPNPKSIIRARLRYRLGKLSDAALLTLQAQGSDAWIDRTIARELQRRVNDRRPIGATRRIQGAR